MNELLAIALTENSFNITGLGMIVDLQHSQLGLKKKTILTSKQSGLSWEVKARVLFDHAVDKQIVFDSESVEFMLLKFSSTEKKEESILNIRSKESQKIFQYYLKPIEHSSKPEDKEKLVINNLNLVPN